VYFLRAKFQNLKDKKSKPTPKSIEKKMVESSVYPSSALAGMVTIIPIGITKVKNHFNGCL
jgi:hypothetical protein